MGKRKLEQQRKVIANRIITNELKKIGVIYTNGMNIQRAAEILAGHHNLFSDGRSYTKIDVAEALSSTFKLGRMPESAIPKKPPREKPRPREPHGMQARIDAFYGSWEWKRLSFDVKLERGRKCECCGAKAPDVRIHTDHVKPIRHYWRLRLDRSNLQILCEDCNMGKGSRNETDFRQSASPPCLDIAPDPRAALDGQPPAESVIWN